MKTYYNTDVTSEIIEFFKYILMKNVSESLEKLVKLLTLLF